MIQRRPTAPGAHPTRRRPPARLLLGGVIVVALLAAAGCGGDDDDDAARDGGTEAASGSGSDGGAATTKTTAAEAGADTAAYCAAELDVVTAGAPNVDYTAPAEEQAQTIVTFVTSVLQPKVALLEPVLPDDLRDEFTTLNGALQQVAAGDLAATDNPEVEAADDSVHAFDRENCGWTQHPVTATEYSFGGIPATLPAEVTSFEMTNEGTELHELVLIRKNDGVTQSFEELLASPDQVLQYVTIVGQAGPIAPGDHDVVTADLTAGGDYLALCSIPVGTTSFDSIPDAPPHLAQGMVTEFTVG